MIPKFVDTIVVGGGTAGSAMASRLIEFGNQSVLLVEAGPDYGPLTQGLWPKDLMDGRVVSCTDNWDYTSSSVHGHPKHSLQRAKVIGGCSSHNGCIALWGSRVDYDRWESDGNIGWSTDEVLPYFKKAASQLKVRDFSLSEITPFHEACLDTMKRMGIPITRNLNNMEENIAVGISPVNIQKGIRWNASFAYLDHVREDSKLTILGNMLANKIKFSNGRAVSLNIVTGGDLVEIAGGRIVLCAGTYESPTILLRSGIGSPELLSHLGIKTVVDLPGVGRNLHDHPSISLEFIGNRQLSHRMGESLANGNTVFTEQSLAKLASDKCTEAFDLHISPITTLSPNSDGLWPCTLAISNMAPKSRGRLFIHSDDPRETPVIDTGYLTDPEDNDLSVLLEGISLARQISSQLPLSELIDRELLQSKKLINASTVRRECRHYYHPVGTCKMGPDYDPMAVVDSQGKVYGTDNVYVADASIMPIIPRANTALPTLMLAEKIASIIGD